MISSFESPLLRSRLQWLARMGNTCSIHGNLVLTWDPSRAIQLKSDPSPVYVSHGNDSWRSLQSSLDGSHLKINFKDSGFVLAEHLLLSTGTIQSLPLSQERNYQLSRIIIFYDEKCLYYEYPHTESKKLQCTISCHTLISISILIKSTWTVCQIRSPKLFCWMFLFSYLYSNLLDLPVHHHLIRGFLLPPPLPLHNVMSPGLVHF